MKGELEAATLPDPLASGAIAAGAVPIVDDSAYPQLAQSVLVFSTEALQNKPDTVRKFVRAWDRAAGEINANPAAYQDLLIQVGRVPESIQGTYAMPPFPQGSITSQSEMQDVVDWMLAKGRIESDIPYERLVDSSFMPVQ
jgi:NitT/TauT family transport system substrate-binding protein